MAYFWVGLIGLLGGLFSGLFGVGGGAIFVPLLILVRHLDPHVAVGTSLVVIIPTALFAAWRHGSVNAVDWPSIFVLALCAVAGAWLGAGMSLKMDAVLLKRLFAVFLAVIAAKMFFQK